MSLLPETLHKRVHKLIKTLQWALIISAVLAGVELYCPYGLSINPSPSLPMGLYWDGPAPKTLHAGELACFSYAPPQWAIARHYYKPGVNFCKWVLGVPGDTIIKKGRAISICHAGQCISAGVVMKTDSEGRPIFAAALPRVIPAGEYYFGSTRVPNSYDSRYLGLIDATTVTRVIHPLFTQSR